MLRPTTPSHAIRTPRRAPPSRIWPRNSFTSRGRGRPSNGARRVRASEQGAPSNKRLKLAGRTRVKESECLCPGAHRISFINGWGGGPCLPAA